MNIKEIIEREGIVLNRDGRYLVGQSPFSDSNLPLLVVDDKNNTFICLSTGINGDAAGFIQNLKGVSKETAERLVQEEKSEEITESDEEKILKNICRDANEFFKEQIKSSKEARDYLEERGFNNEDILKYEFGYAPNYGNSLYQHLRHTYDKELILKSGVCKVDKEKKIVDLFWKRLIIPIRDNNGDIVAFGGRVLGDGTPKFP